MLKEEARLRGGIITPTYLIAGGAILLALLYTRSYLAYPALPGKVPQFPLGWWGWFDQGKTLESARALALGDLAPAQHWYPLGYSALAAPFWHLSQAHPFFFVDMVLLLAAYLGFVAFARRAGVPAIWSALLFLFTTVADHKLFAQWVIPWNTTASGAFLWLLLATTAAHMEGLRRPFLVGLLAAAIPLFRPPEAVLATACVMAALITDIRGKRLRLPDAGHFMAGAALPIVPYALLYLHIYGPHPTEYTLISQKIGFTLYDIGWKAYVLLIEPRGWFMDGEGLLRRAPWIAFGIGGIVPALARSRGPTKLLAVVLVLHAVLYLSYVDLLPTGFWRYNNVHYWTWILPGYGLLGLLLVRDLVRPQSRRGAIIAWASLTATGLMLCVQLEPRPASADEPAKMIELPGIRSGFDNIYFGQWVLHDGSGDLGNVSFVRGVPTPGGLRVLALRRPIAGAVTWAANPAGWQITQSPLRWRIGISIGLPCWVGFLRCPSPPVSGLLPPPPP